MITTLDSINQDMRQAIYTLYQQGISIADISKTFLLSYNEILALINIIDHDEAPLKEALAQYDLGNEKFIVISDTHFGSELEDPYYIDVVYEFAKRDGIQIILHTGDFYQSTKRPVSQNFRDLTKQVEHGLSIYPQDNSIENYILLGNHDFHLCKRSDEYYQILSSRSDFHILGYKKAYLKWCQKLLLAHHQIDKYHIHLPSVEVLLTISGHRHEMRVLKGHTINAPALCNDMKYYGMNPNMPGFLVIEAKDNKMNVSHYLFENTKVQSQGVVLTKYL